MLQAYNEWKYNSHDFTPEELKKYASFWLEKSSKLKEIRYTMIPQIQIIGLGFHAITG